MDTVPSLTPDQKRELLTQLLHKRASQTAAAPQEASPLPRIVPRPEERHNPFPLNDIQQAYWIGRSSFFELGNVGTHAYLEFDGAGLSPERLSRAWRQLIERHDMLRAIILPDGQQQVLADVPDYEIAVADLRTCGAEQAAAALAAIRSELSHQVLPTDRWPMFEIRATLLDQERVRVHFSFDILIADLASLQILFREWGQLYADRHAALAPLEITFRDYVLAERDFEQTPAYQRSLAYWRKRLEHLPGAPELPLAVNPAAISQPRFVRRTARLEPAPWQRLKLQATALGLSPSSFLLAVFSEVLAAWSKQPRFTINLTLFNRLPLHQNVYNVVGDFTSLILLEADMTAAPTFAERAGHLQQQLLTDLDHRYVSGVRVLRELARTQPAGSRLAMPIVFTSALIQHLKSDDTAPMDWLGALSYSISQTPQVWLDHQVFEDGGALVFSWDAVEEIFTPALLDTMFAAYCDLLDRLAGDQALWNVPGLSALPAEQMALQQAMNATEAPLPIDLLQSLFAAQVPRRPDHPAVIAPDRTLSYQQLFDEAMALGRLLRDQGAAPNTLVAVVMEKGWEQVAAVLGVLFAGAAYLPIDPSLPRERLWHLLEHGQVRLALTQPGLEQRLVWPDHVQPIVVRPEMAAPGAPLAPAQRLDDLAYVIYTSGSTGLPKGVMIDHRGAANTILDVNSSYAVGPDDRVLALSSLSFDLSVYDIFGLLAAGGSIVMPEPEATRDPARWAELIEREHVSIWNSVPALLELLVEYLEARTSGWPAAPRTALLSGDWLPVRLPDRLRALAPHAAVVSMGGATEASIWSIFYPIAAVDPAWPSIPYGRPMRNQRFYVLDDRLDPRPIGVPGQLYIGGVGLAQGYWRDDQKTQASFSGHPRTGERLYRTGDLGRYLPSGDIEFLGREDFQVKIQGFRVELGEIEAVLAQHPAVRLAALAAHESVHGSRQLAAYVIPAQPITADALRGYLQERLPGYMVPTTIMLLDQLPLSSNGKVDRRALPAPSSEPPAPAAEQPPAPETPARQIAGLIASVLKLDEVGPDQSLLELGADSVAMIRIVNLLERELAFRPRIEEFYRQPTARGLALAYERQRGGPSTPAARQPAAPSPWSAFALIADPRERQAFKQRQPGLRQGSPPARISLDMAPAPALAEIYAARRTHRQFAQEPLQPEQLGAWLASLAQGMVDQQPKYSYGSAGGSYPVQTYLAIKAGRVSGIPGGIYYYHPVERALIAISEAALDPTIYDPFINRPIFTGAALAVFLVAEMAAIAPLYGEDSLRFTLLEAGLMTQLLEMAAPLHGLGLCQIGGLDVERVRPIFQLSESHVFLHSLVGGPIDADSVWRPYPELPAAPAEPTTEWEEGEI